MVNNSKTHLIVLAAGFASRYGGLKQLVPVGPSGETILEYSIYDAIRAGFKKVVFVIQKSTETAFRETISTKFKNQIEVAYVYQELENVPKEIVIPKSRTKPWGTGHAILVAAKKVDGPFAVINADDFYGANSFQLIYNYISTLNPKEIGGCLIGYRLKNAMSKNGSVSRGICETSSKGFLKKITERTQISKNKELGIYYTENGENHSLSGEELVSMNLAGFTHLFFNTLKSEFEEFIINNYNHPKAEYYFPNAIDKLVKAKINIPVIETPDMTFGMTYKNDKIVVVNNIKKLIKEGVYPESLWKS